MQLATNEFVVSHIKHLAAVLDFLVESLRPEIEHHLGRLQSLGLGLEIAEHPLGDPSDHSVAGDSLLDRLAGE